MNRHIEFLRGESSAGGSNWNSEMQAAADEIKRLEMLVRECHAALRDLLDKRPMQGAMLCGSTTLGNLFVDLNGAVSTMADSRSGPAVAPNHGADLALIAAAPDLLAALQWVIDYAPTGADEARCRAAIAKAAGRES